jgi:hypothetical protein
MNRSLFLLLTLLLYVRDGAHAEVPSVAEQERGVAGRLGLRGARLDVADRPAFILMPEDWPSEEPQPWVMYAPTLPDYPDKHEAWMHKKFLDAGIVVVGIDCDEAYGNDRCVALMNELHKQLVERRGFPEKCCALGRSRGGLWVTAWAAANPEKVAGIAGIYPCFDLRTYPGLEKAAPAYGLTATELEAKLPQLNPIEKVGAIAEAGIPAYFIHGADDAVVPLKENSAEFAARYKAAGKENLVPLNVVEGQGHNFWEGFFRCQELVNFVIKQAREGAKAR